ncbi:MAG TPA: patatin-like phospholipase family protein [Xanthobacteraceae bacterium]|jgi:NTE family protein|nr:patatin-like phospholipase family protein [Xanthobacteraceae bacterium]
MSDRRPPPRPASYDKKVGLVLQGGGALGSYQAGVYEALATSQYQPGWVAGISIGAINAALIAGNAPGRRVERLRAFWDEITAPTSLWPAAPGGPLADWRQKTSALTSVLFGQPGFFAPRGPQDWFSPERPLSYYDTSALRATLERLVDFDRINDTREIRLSVGAVNVQTGHFAYFDSEKIAIRPEHVMASGALPPGFPPVEIDGELYWDGGLFSNTPLQYMVDYNPRRSRLIFQVDVFQAFGCLPTDLDGVNERDKDIRYSSRTRVVTDTLRERHNVRHDINELHKILPPEIANTPQARRLYEHGCVTEMDLAQLIYRPMAPQGASKDFEFSRATMEARWQAGLSDARTTLLASPWLAPVSKDLGVRIFDVMHDILVRHHAPAPDARVIPMSAARARPAG